MIGLGQLLLLSGRLADVDHTPPFRGGCLAKIHGHGGSNVGGGDRLPGCLCPSGRRCCPTAGRLALGLVLGATIVIRRRFDPDAVLDDLERHRIRTRVAVPVMHQRILRALGSSARRHETSSLRVLISAAAPLTPALAGSLMDAFGDVLYNIYGTTETGFGAIAGPEDLRAAPGTVGRARLGGCALDR